MAMTEPEYNNFGRYIRDVRQVLDMTLRDVESLSERAITNGYLSQIEKGLIKRPSPNVLFQLARVYGIDYADLLRRVGHRVPHPETADGGQDPSKGGRVLAGLPKRAVAELSEDEESELLEYLAFIRKRRAKQTPDQ